MLKCSETSVPFYFVEIPFKSDSRPYDVLMQHEEMLKYIQLVHIWKTEAN